MTKEQSVEILMTTYNGELFLREQFDSILAQTYRNWHLTVSDDGSTDGTDCIIEEYVHLYPDKILHVRYPERFGSPKEHFLQLCRDCEAPLIAFCDQDDVWFPDKLKKMACSFYHRIGVCIRYFIYYIPSRLNTGCTKRNEPRY